MPLASLLIATLLVWLLLVAGVLRSMAIARRADELADRHWEQLARMHSESGIAFFPTSDARLELGMAMAEVLDLRLRRVRRPTGASIGLRPQGDEVRGRVVDRVA